jgi:3-hydroxypropionyl-CoA synthetase (ADP-forming)
MILNYKKREELLKEYGLNRPETYLVNSKSEALEKANLTGYPVVAKISSDKHLHRTELNGVEVDIKSDQELEKVFDRLIKIEGVEGIIIQKQINGVEFIVGAKNDPTFGPIIMLGTGGTLVELFKDVTFRVAPIDLEEAKKMIEEIKGKKLLEGFRSYKKMDKEKLAKILSQTSKLAHDKKIKELDFNPVIANEKEILICDVKIVL